MIQGVWWIEAKREAQEKANTNSNSRAMHNASQGKDLM